MKDFNKLFPTEEACREHFKKQREDKGIVCKKCQSQKHYWLKNKWQWQCAECKFRTTLRSGTFMEFSKMSFMTWYTVIFFFTINSYSANFIQKKLVKHKRYEPIWAMIHKLRKSIAKLNEELFDKSSEMGLGGINAYSLGIALEKELKEDLKRMETKTAQPRAALCYDYLLVNKYESHINSRLKKLRTENNCIQLTESVFRDLTAAFEDRIKRIYRTIKVDYLVHYLSEFLHFVLSDLKENKRFDALVWSVSRGW